MLIKQRSLTCFFYNKVQIYDLIDVKLTKKKHFDEIC